MIPPGPWWWYQGQFNFSGMCALKMFSTWTWWLHTVLRLMLTCWKEADAVPCLTHRKRPCGRHCKGSSEWLNPETATPCIRQQESDQTVQTTQVSKFILRQNKYCGKQQYANSVGNRGKYQTLFSNRYKIYSDFVLSKKQLFWGGLGWERSVHIIQQPMKLQNQQWLLCQQGCMHGLSPHRTEVPVGTPAPLQ